MDPIQIWTLAIVSATFLLYIVIAVWSRAANTGEFYIAGKGVHADSERDGDGGGLDVVRPRLSRWRD